MIVSENLDYDIWTFLIFRFLNWHPPPQLILEDTKRGTDLNPYFLKELGNVNNYFHNLFALKILISSECDRFSPHRNMNL